VSSIDLHTLDLSAVPAHTVALSAALAQLATQFEMQAVGALPRDEQRLTLAAQTARVLHDIVREAERGGADALHDATRRAERLSCWADERALAGDAAHAVALCNVVVARLTTAVC
jgi:hypothetical protein